MSGSRITRQMDRPEIFSSEAGLPADTVSFWRYFRIIAMMALAWMFNQNRRTNELIGEANAIVLEATELSRIAKQKNEALAVLSTDDGIKHRRAELQAAAQEMSEALCKTAAKWREVAELNDQLVGRIDDDVDKRLCAMRRDSFRALAEAAEANVEASRV